MQINDALNWRELLGKKCLNFFYIYCLGDAIVGEGFLEIVCLSNLFAFMEKFKWKMCLRSLFWGVRGIFKLNLCFVGVLKVFRIQKWNF